MPGEFKYTAANTTASQTADPGLAKAFCQGREAQVAGDNSNPFVSGSEDNVAWQAGHDTVTPEGLIDNCALAIPITVPQTVGQTIAAARVLIISAGLAVNDITGSVGVIISQIPTAGAKVQPNTTVRLLAQIVTPLILGATETAAIAAIVASGLIKGTVTGTTGVVTVQNPVAGAPATLGSAVNFTLA